MLRIRLRRVGAKKQPSYRIVVAESTSPRDGKFVEVVGFYNPRTEPETVTIKEDRALHWLSVGASPSDAVMRLLKNNGTLDRFVRLKAGENLADLLDQAEEEKASRSKAAEIVKQTLSAEADDASEADLDEESSENKEEVEDEEDDA
jgi:small subunit ribosomal protein S16